MSLIMRYHHNRNNRLLIAVIFFIGLACNQTKRISKTNGPAKDPCFLFLSDIHLDSDTDTSIYGEDTGLHLWNNFLQKADSVLAGDNSPQFIIYTGDLPAHYNCNNVPNCYLAPDKRADHNKDLIAILTGLKNLADKYHKPLFYMPGNNDALSGNYHSFADEQQQTALSLIPENGNDYPALNTSRKSNKAPCLVSMPQPTMGYYSVRPVEGLRLICLNTVMYDKKFTTDDKTDKDVDRSMQLTWLATQLSEASALNEKVYIAMHIPPGKDAYSNGDMWVVPANRSQSWLNIFLSLTQKYSSSITGIFYGHTHMDEVRRLYDSTGSSITEIAISAPGVTPQHNNNPGFKTVFYNKDSKEVMDFTTYYTAPAQSFWGTNTYNFSSVFSSPSSNDIYQRLSSMSLPDITTAMTTIYSVKNGPVSYNIQNGIEVKWE